MRRVATQVSWASPPDDIYLSRAVLLSDQRTAGMCQREGQRARSGPDWEFVPSVRRRATNPPSQTLAETRAVVSPNAERRAPSVPKRVWSRLDESRAQPAR